VTEKTQLYKIAREVFEEATTPILGSNIHEVICFHLKQRIGRDPYQALLEEPKTFYDELEKIFSNGANILLNHVGKCLADKYGANCSPEEFAELLYRGDESSKDKIIEIMMKIREKKNKNSIVIRYT